MANDEATRLMLNTLRARSSEAELAEQCLLFAGNTLLGQMLDAVPQPFVAVNQKLHVLFANKAIEDLSGIPRKELIGMRWGEMVGCVNADRGPFGCGTSDACTTCEVVGSLISAVGGEEVSSEARMTLSTGEPLDVRIDAKSVDGIPEVVILASVTDIEHEQRRRVLEQTFFHDILNTAGGVQGLAVELPYADENETHELISMLESSSKQLVDEILYQRMLVNAESGELVVNQRPTDAISLATDVIATYRNHDVANGTSLILEAVDPESGIEVDTDIVLMRRILGNLVKNALEASEPGMAVTIGIEQSALATEFSVHSEPAMPRDVQQQVFQRSFSTKGSGRGIGTYGTRLLTESYLRGSVTFTSSDAEGTRFLVRLPRQMSPHLAVPSSAELGVTLVG